MRHTGRIAFALLTVLALTAPLAPARAADALPEALQSALETAMKDKLRIYGQEKNADGVTFKRATYSKTFRKVSDSTYLGTYHLQTAGPSDAKTERFEVTLSKGADGKWAITKEDVKDTVVGLVRFVPGDEKFFRFDRFRFDREGLKVTATNGTLYQDFIDGKPTGLTLAAADLTYEYQPPADAVHKTHAYNYYKTEFAKDLIFKPHHLSLYADPVSFEELVAETFQGLAPIEKAQASPVLLERMARLENTFRSKLKENAFHAFRILPYADRREYLLVLNRAGADPTESFIGAYDKYSNEYTNHSVWLSYDDWSTLEVGYGVSRLGDTFTGYAPIVAYNAAETRALGLSPHDLEARPDPEARFYEVESLTGTLEMALIDDTRMDADLTYVLKLKDDMEMIEFFILDVEKFVSGTKQNRNNLYVNSIQDGSGQELTVVRTGPHSGFVKLPKPGKKGDTLNLRVQFANLGGIIKANPSYSYVSRGGWLPFIRFSDQIAPVDLTVKAPAKYKTLGVGKKVSEKKEGDVLVTRWVAEKPISFLTIIFGDYEEAPSSHQATKSDGTPIPVVAYVDKVSMQQLDMDIQSYEGYQEFQRAASTGARGIRGKQLAPIATQAAVALDLYKELFGVDYPYGKLDLVNDPAPALYGQAPSSITYLGSWVFRGTGTMAGNTTIGMGAFQVNSTQISKFLKSVVAHEVGHQWWGSVVTNRNGLNYWFVETLAEYASAIYLERVFGRKEYLEQVEEWRKTVLDQDYTVGVQEAAYVASPDNGNYQAAVYNRGPLAFHILRTTFGDEAFFPFLKKLAQTLAHKEIVTRDIQQISEESFKGNMDWFWDQWIRGAGIPEYTLQYTSRRTEDGKWLVQGTIKQRVVVGKKKYTIPGQYYRGLIPIVVRTRGGKQFKLPKPVLVDAQAETPFQFKSPEEPLEVVLNRENEIFAHDVVLNQK